MKLRGVILNTTVSMSEETFTVTRPRYETTVSDRCDKPCVVLDYKNHRAITCPSYHVNSLRGEIIELCEKAKNGSEIQ